MDAEREFLKAMDWPKPEKLMKQVNINAAWIDRGCYGLASVLAENPEVRKYLLVNGQPFTEEALDEVWKQACRSDAFWNSSKKSVGAPIETGSTGE